MLGPMRELRAVRLRYGDDFAILDNSPELNVYSR